MNSKEVLSNIDQDIDISNIFSNWLFVSFGEVWPKNINVFTIRLKQLIFERD